MMYKIFDKTDKGRDEIATRENRLPPRLRTLLLLVDGKREAVELMTKVAGLGLNEKSLVELLEGGYIQISADPENTMPTVKIQALPSPPPATQSPQREPVTHVDVSPAVRSSSAMSPIVILPETGTAEPVAASISPGEPVASESIAGLREGETQFQALYNFFNETIRSAIGLRGYAIQLKVERCSTIADFKALRQTYLDAVLKAKGSEMERSLRERLDTLLQLGD